MKICPKTISSLCRLIMSVYSIKLAAVPRLASTMHNVDITDVDALKMEAIFNQYSFWYPPWFTTVKITGLQSQNDSPALSDIFTSESLLKCTIWVFSIVSHVLVHSPGWGNVFCGSSLLNTEHRLYVEWLSSWCALALSWDRKSPLYSLRLCVFRPWWAEASGWLVCACEKFFPYDST